MGSPLHESGTLQLDANQPMGATEFTVATDSTWVIEYVSAWIIVPAGETFRPLEIWTSAPTLPEGTSRPHHYFTPVPLAGSDSWYCVSQPTRLYAMPGSDVRVQFIRNSPSGQGSVQFTLSGSLLDD